MAYFKEQKRGGKDKKRAYSEEKSGHRYAKSNRYTEKRSSQFSQQGNSSNGPAAFRSYTKQTGFNSRDGWQQETKTSYRKSDRRNIKKGQAFEKRKFEGEYISNRKPSKTIFNKTTVPAPAGQYAVSHDAIAPKDSWNLGAEQDENVLLGRNPIREALKAGRDIEKMLVSEGNLSGSAREIVSMARKANVKIQMVQKSHLDRIARNHQGMIAYASAYHYAQIEDMLTLAEEKNENPFLVVLDQITDPHNLGAIIRTAACCGVHGVIIPRHRAVGLTSAAVKTSAGAVEYVKVARVTNIAQTLKQLKQHGIWAFAADMAGNDYRKADFTVGTALVIGSEGDGISPVVRSQCDATISIPMTGDISSLNASVAAGILMHAVYCARFL